MKLHETVRPVNNSTAPRDTRDTRDDAVMCDDDAICVTFEGEELVEVDDTAGVVGDHDSEDASGRGSTSAAPQHPEPESEATGKGASLAPSHTKPSTSRRSDRQGPSREAPPHKRTVRGPRGGGDGGALTVASTGSSCDVTGLGSPGLESGSEGALEAAGGLNPTGAVTPVGFVVGPSDTLPASVRVQPLRAAFDWFEVFCVCAVSPAVWEGLLGLVRSGDASDVYVCGAGTVPVVWKRLGRDVVGHCIAGVHVVVACPLGDGQSETSSDTVGVLPRRPGEERAELYGVRVQVQGRLFSGVSSGGESTVREVWRALAKRLYGDQVARMVSSGTPRGSGGGPPTMPLAPDPEGPAATQGTGKARGQRAPRRGPPDVAELLESETRVGRVDFALDVALCGAGAEDWISENIYGGGNMDRAWGLWSVRARSKSLTDLPPPDDAEVAADGRRVMLGESAKGRTYYIGKKSYLEGCFYERSKKKDGAWEVLAETLRARGWDGVSPVVRSEFRASRRWMGDQVPRAEGSDEPMFTKRVLNPSNELVTVGRSLAEVTLEEWLSISHALAVAFPSRMRHTDPDDPHKRKRERASSSWWTGVQAAAKGWADGLVSNLCRVVSVRRVAAAARTLSCVRSGLARLFALLGALELADVLGEVRRAWMDPTWYDAREAYIRRVRMRFGLDEPERPLREDGAGVLDGAAPWDAPCEGVTG